MTEEQKEQLIAKMLDAPDSLSDAEMELILHDDEMREIYEVSSSLSGTCLMQPEVDAAKEWARFRPRLMRKPSLMRRFMRVAAIFMGVMLVSAAMVKLVDHLLLKEEPPVTAMVDRVKVDESPAMPQEQSPQAAPEKLVSVRTAAGQRSCDAPEEKQPEPEPELDIDEYLRIQQARIDNDLAMQDAEIFADEYAILRQAYDIIGENDEIIESAIRLVTMQ